MGNCVGHSNQKHENKISGKTQNKQDNSEDFKTTLNIELQETNKETLTPGISAVEKNSKSTTKEIERQNSSMFTDTGKVAASTEEVRILIPG